MQPIVSDVHFAVAIHLDGRGPNELAIAFAVGAELADELLVERANGNAHAIGPIFVRAVRDVDQVIGAERHVDGIAESRAAKLVAANGVAVIERPVDETKKMGCHNASTPSYHLTDSQPHMQLRVRCLLLSDRWLIEKPLCQSCRLQSDWRSGRTRLPRSSCRSAGSPC